MGVTGGRHSFSLEPSTASSQWFTLGIVTRAQECSPVGREGGAKGAHGEEIKRARKMSCMCNSNTIHSTHTNSQKPLLFELRRYKKKKERERRKRVRETEKETIRERQRERETEKETQRETERETIRERETESANYTSTDQCEV